MDHDARHCNIAEGGFPFKVGVKGKWFAHPSMASTCKEHRPRCTTHQYLRRPTKKPNKIVAVCQKSRLCGRVGKVPTIQPISMYAERCPASPYVQPDRLPRPSKFGNGYPVTGIAIIIGISKQETYLRAQMLAKHDRLRTSTPTIPKPLYFSFKHWREG